MRFLQKPPGQKLGTRQGRRIGRPRGARPQLLVEGLEGRALLSLVTINGTLANDVITLRTNPANVAEAQVWVNGALDFQGQWPDSITINGLLGNDTINIQAAKSPVTLNGGDGNDTINLSDTDKP